MISSNLKQRWLTHRLVGDGDLDAVIHTQVEGFSKREVSLLECVRADQDGVVIMLRGLPRIKAGDGIAHITQCDHPQ